MRIAFAFWARGGYRVIDTDTQTTTVHETISAVRRVIASLKSQGYYVVWG